MGKKSFLLMLSMLFVCIGAFAQSEVSGVVVSADDQSPIAGVVVSVQGATTGTMTDENGAYFIKADKDATLLFSCLGFKEVSVPVEGRRIVNVSLVQDNLLIDESVVTAVGIQRSERSLGYSVTKVDADEAIQKAEPDLLRALDGKIAGVNVSAPSGDAGGATRITIRGNSSFLGNNQPLYVVDGVPYSNEGMASRDRAGEIGAAFTSGLSTLDPNDIESMNVLKGAAAAVLYGSRAANGVVLITTKSGSHSKKANKGYSVTYTGSVALETIGALPDYQNKYGQGSNFIISGANGSWGAPFTEGATMSMYSDIAAEYPGLALELYPDLEGKIPYKAYPNNVKDLFRTGVLSDHSVNLQSVNDKGNFNVTLSYTDQNSYIPGSDFDRYAFSVGGNQQLNDRLRIGGSLAYTYTVQDSPLYGNNQSSAELGGQSSLARAFIMPRSWDIQNFPYQTLDGSNLLFQLSSQANNPYWAWENDKVASVQRRTVANFNFTYKILDWLSFDYTVGYNDYDNDARTVINLGSRGYAGKGFIRKRNYSHDALEQTVLLTAEKQIEDFNVRATLGHNYNQTTWETEQYDGLEIVNKNIFSIGNTKSQKGAEEYRRFRKWGMFADILLNYKDWAFLNLSGRMDKSSTLPMKNNTYFYPAVSASVVFTEALDIKSSVLNFGKVRASWAKVGNDASPYYNNGTYVTGYPYMGQPLMELPTTLYDENLSPEFTSEFETGLELKLFDGRIGFDGTFYNRISEDQIGQKTSAPSTGYGSYVTNFGSIRNRGYELGLDLYPVVSADFSWSIYTTFTQNKSKVLSLAEGVDKINVGGDFANPKPVLVVGQPYGILEGEKLARDDEGNPLVDPSTGMYINDKEYGFIGDPNPDYKVSMINTFKWKGLSLGVMFDFQKGGCVYSTYLTDLLGRGVTKDTEDRLGSRIIPGVYANPNTLEPYLDENNNKIPNTTTIAESDLWFSSGTYSTYAINSCDEVATYDATVLRLREVTLSYALPKKLIAKLPLSGVEFGIVGRNLWFYAPNVPKYSNYDPVVNSYGETNVQGIDYTSAPSTRRFAFNVKLTF